MNKYNISYLGFVFYWLEGSREHAQVVTVVKRDIMVKVVIEA